MSVQGNLNYSIAQSIRIIMKNKQYVDYVSFQNINSSESYK